MKLMRRYQQQRQLQSGLICVANNVVFHNEVYKCGNVRKPSPISWPIFVRILIQRGRNRSRPSRQKRKSHRMESDPQGEARACRLFLSLPIAQSILTLCLWLLLARCCRLLHSTTSSPAHDVYICASHALYLCNYSAHTSVEHPEVNKVVALSFPHSLSLVLSHKSALNPRISSSIDHGRPKPWRPYSECRRTPPLAS